MYFVYGEPRKSITKLIYILKKNVHTYFKGMVEIKEDFLQNLRLTMNVRQDTFTKASLHTTITISNFSLKLLFANYYKVLFMRSGCTN